MYNKQNFEDDQILEAEHLNNIEQGLVDLSSEVDEIANSIATDKQIELSTTGYVEGSSSKTWHSINTNEGSLNSGYVEIPQGFEYVEASVFANEYIFAILFFDSNKNALYEPSVIGDSRTASYLAEIPSAAKYVIVSAWNTDETTFDAFFTNGNFAEDIADLNARVSALETPDRDLLFEKSEFAIFKQWGIVGDSLSVGHTTDTDGNASSPNLHYSWGQYLARDVGNTCLHFGASGLSAKAWMSSDNGYNLLVQAGKLCQCYIIALGANDADYTLGSIADVDFTNMDNNADTEYGWYAKVINAVRTTAPQAPIFLFTLPYPRNTDTSIQAINGMIREFAANTNFNNIYLVDLDANYNEYFAEGKLYNCIGNTGWHLTALGYLYAAKVNEMAISKVISENYSAFQNVFEIPYSDTTEDGTAETTTETWTFELEGGTTVEKTVVIA